MPKRKNFFKVTSEDVQGEGSFVVLKAITYGEGKRLRKALKDMDDDEKQAENDKLLVAHVHEWNWVDDEDEALPQLKDDPAVLDLLTAQEVNFIGEALKGGATKN